MTNLKPLRLWIIVNQLIKIMTIRQKKGTMTKTRLSKIVCDIAQGRIDKSITSIKLREKRTEINGL